MADDTVDAGKILLATGSLPMPVPGTEFVLDEVPAPEPAADDLSPTYARRGRLLEKCRAGLILVVEGLPLADQAISRAGHRLDREAARCDTRRDSAHAADRAVQTIVADEHAAPAAREQHVARDDRSIGFGKGKQDLHDARLDLDVAARAGVDPALIYHYFGDKDRTSRRIDGCLAEDETRLAREVGGA